MILKKENRTDIKKVIHELTKLNSELERLIEKLPTNDDKVLASLNSGFNSLSRLLYVKTTVEKGSILYEQAVGKAMSLRERYNYKLTSGGLRIRNQ